MKWLVRTYSYGHSIEDEYGNTIVSELLRADDAKAVVRAHNEAVATSEYVLCVYCRTNGKVHVEVRSDQMVDNDHVWAMMNGADIYHRKNAHKEGE